MLCTRCQSFCQSAAAQIQVLEKGTVRWGAHSAVHHRGLAQLQAASDARCPICRAVYFTPTEYERPALPESCVVVLELDPQDGAHPVLSTTFQDDAGGVLVPKRIVAIYSGFVDDEELSSTLSKCAGVENDSTGSDASFRLASFWLKRCLETHKECSKFTTTPLFMPTRVLDVGSGEVRLVETAEEHISEADRRYVALSHCWGKIHIITTKKDTLKDRLQGIRMDDLSKTFQDAVEATRKLGFRYIWIDSLCIVQDDGPDWEKEAAQMCKIYQKAALTIAAAHAPGGDVGCFKERDGILQLPVILDFPISEDHQNVPPVRALFTSYGRSEGLGGPEPPLYGRAWVLQEQILSPRMLIFDGPQLRWECLCMHGSERSPQGGMSRHIGHHKTIRSGIMDDTDFFSWAQHFDSPSLAARAKHQEWCYAIMDYTHRGMTKPSDRLVAIAGIAQAVQANTANAYLAGLWRDQLWLGLLWSIPHEAEYTPTTTRAFDVESNAKIRHDAPIAPSWSWVAVTAPVVYPVPTVGASFVQRMCDILDASTHGTAARQAGRLRVRAHVRKGFVNAVYPHAIREAAQRARPGMQFGAPSGGGTALVEHCGRGFHPHEFFLFAPTAPRCRSDWRLVRGEWRPDEVLDARMEVTFMAVAQQGRGPKVATHREGDPLQVFALGLVPTGRAEGEYRRVGYGVWDDCAWYGYVCGEERRLARGWTPTSSRWYWKVAERIRWKTPVAVKVKDGVHDHHFKADALPDEGLYHEAVGVREESLIIV